MRIGLMLSARAGMESIGELEARARSFEVTGFDSLWVPHVFGFDAISLAALVGRATERIEIGTAVVPTQPRHPAALAQAALTAGAAAGGRFTLGIGLSHPLVIEAMYGLSYERRANHMRDFMAVLAPLLRGQRADVAGGAIRAAVELDIAGAPEVPVLIAALGERMLEIAGRTASGTILWMTGIRTIANHIVPRIGAAAHEAGRPSPRVVAGMNVCLTSDPEAAHTRLERMFAVYRQMPSYRAMVEREGSDDVGDFVLVGDEKALDAGLSRLRDAGVTDLEASIVKAAPGDDERTIAFLADHARRRGNS